MTNQSKKIVFFGNERLATGVRSSTPTLIKLIENGYEISALVLNQRFVHSRSDRDPEIIKIAARYDIPILSPDIPGGLIEKLSNTRADIGVLVAFGRIVPKGLIDLFPYGIINVHPSLLPKHRGSTPIESVILSGDAQTGVSIMQLAETMDSGPVFSQRVIELTGKESKQELSDALSELGSTMIIEVLPKVLEGTSTQNEQNESEATFDKLINKADGEVNWSKSAIQIEREIRAFAGWPKSYTKLGDVKLVIIKANVVENSSLSSGEIDITDGLLVGCGQNALRIHELKPAGKNNMDASAFIAGYRNRIT